MKNVPVPVLFGFCEVTRNLTFSWSATTGQSDLEGVSNPKISELSSIFGRFLDFSLFYRLFPFLIIIFPFIFPFTHNTHRLKTREKNAKIDKRREFLWFAETVWKKTVKLLSSGNIQPFIQAEKSERQNHRKVTVFWNSNYRSKIRC